MRIITPNKCADCYHSLLVGKDLLCRRFPPSPHPVVNQMGQVATVITAWPVVQPHDFCGEFKQGIPAPKGTA